MTKGIDDRHLGQVLERTHTVTKEIVDRHLGQALERTHTVANGIVDRHLGQALERTHTVTEGTILTDRRNCSSTSRAKGIVILTSRASPRAYTYRLTDCSSTSRAYTYSHYGDGGYFSY